MPSPDAPPVTRGVVIRWLGFAIAVALGAVAVWLVVTSTSQKRIELGVLAGLWGALVGAFAVFGSRRFLHPHEQAQQAPGPGSELQLRAATELERAEEAAARRAHEARLEHLLRREIQASVAREVAGLREEIAGLRSELVEKVGGQLRLERIETTRVIGSDLEALQHEVRQLKQVAAQDTGEFAGLARSRSPEPLRQIVEPARVRPVSRQTAEVESLVQPAVQPAVQPVAGAPLVERPPLGPEPAPPVQPQPVAAQSAPQPVPPRAPRPIDATGPIRYVAPAPTPSEPAIAEPATGRPAAPAPVPPPAAATPPPPAVPVSPPPAAPIPAAPAPQPATPQPATLQPAAPPAPSFAPAPSFSYEPPVPASPPQPAPAPPAAPAPTPNPVHPGRGIEPDLVAATEPRPGPAPVPAPAFDDFASLPRIRPFTDFELDPIVDEPDYTGRRRSSAAEQAAAEQAAAEQAAAEQAAAGGRHAHAPGEHRPEPPVGRRHRRADDSEHHDLLARLLARENR